jgi:hypothetical protein
MMTTSTLMLLLMLSLAATDSQPFHLLPYPIAFVFKTLCIINYSLTSLPIFFLPTLKLMGLL